MENLKLNLRKIGPRQAMFDVLSFERLLKSPVCLCKLVTALSLILEAGKMTRGNFMPITWDQHWSGSFGAETHRRKHSDKQYSFK